MEKIEQYIVEPSRQFSPKTSAASSLLEFLQIVERNPDISVQKIIGDSNNPRRLIIHAKPESIKILESFFGGRLIIEKDEQLTMF